MAATNRLLKVILKELDLWLAYLSRSIRYRELSLERHLKESSSSSHAVLAKQDATITGSAELGFRVGFPNVRCRWLRKAAWS